MRQEQDPSLIDPGGPYLHPAVWEQLRDHVQEVAHQIDLRIQQTLAEGENREKNVEAVPRPGRRLPAGSPALSLSSQTAGRSYSSYVR